MKWPWFDFRWVHFWQPILDPTEQPWRDLHVRAHVLGGMVWGMVFRFLLVASPHGGWVVDFRHSVALRLLGVAVVQATLWELIQRENWRTDFDGTVRPEGAQYPWLSALWDVVFTVAGAALLEILALLLGVLV